MKIGFFLFLTSLSFAAQALTSFPLQFGVGTDACHPNSEGLKECHYQSPSADEIVVPLEYVPEGNMAYGYHAVSGHFEKMGFTVSVKVTHFPDLKIDDMLTLMVTTWDLANPESTHETMVETFTEGPMNLSRLNLPGFAIGSEENYSNVILSVRKSQK